MDNPERNHEARKCLRFQLPELLLNHVRRHCSSLGIQPTVYVRRAADILLYMEDLETGRISIDLEAMGLTMQAIDSVRQESVFKMMSDDEVRVHLQQLEEFEERSGAEMQPWQAGYTSAPVWLSEEESMTLALIAMRDGYRDERSLMVAAVTRLAWMYDYALNGSR